MSVQTGLDKTLQALSVCDYAREFLSLVDHLLNLDLHGHSAHEMLFLIDFNHLGREIGGIAVSELLDCVHTRCLKQLCELRTHALDTEEICVVGPGKDELSIDACSLLESLAACRAGTFVKKLGGGFDARSDEFLGEYRADTLNINNFVCHNYSC